MTSHADELDLSDPGIYPNWTPITIRFSDEDRMGHVNNSTYSVWVEAARVLLIQRFLEPAPEWLDTVLARITIDFRKETRFPGEVRIGARLLSVGNRSLRSGYGVFRDQECLATAVCVNVYFDTRERRSAEPPQTVRRAMEAELAR